MIPLVTKILDVMDQKGLIDLPLKMNGLEVKVSAVAPLAMAQNMEDVQNILQYAQIAQSSGPEAQATLKVGSMMDFIAEKLGVPQRVRTTAAERQQAMQQSMQMAQQAVQANPQIAAEAAKGLMKGQ